MFLDGPKKILPFRVWIFTEMIWSWVLMKQIKVDLEYFSPCGANINETVNILPRHQMPHICEWEINSNSLAESWLLQSNLTSRSSSFYAPCAANITVKGQGFFHVTKHLIFSIQKNSNNIFIMLACITLNLSSCSFWARRVSEKGPEGQGKRLSVFSKNLISTPQIESLTDSTLT